MDLLNRLLLLDHARVENGALLRVFYLSLVYFKRVLNCEVAEAVCSVGIRQIAGQKYDVRLNLSKKSDDPHHVFLLWRVSSSKPRSVER